MAHRTSFWRWLEARPSRTGVLAEWERAAGDHFAAVRPLLQPVEESATVYPDPRHSSRMLRVVRHTDGQIVGIDDRDWRRRVPLARKDIVLYRLELRALRKTVCDSLSCVNIARTPIDESAGRIHIGNWEPKKAASFPVFLLMCPNPSGLTRAVHAVIAERKNPEAILLTPTRSNWTDATEDTARDQKMLLIALGEVLDVVSGSFCESPAWEEYLLAFCQLVRTQLPANYKNKRPARMRASRTAGIELLEKAMEAHLRSARDHAYTQIDRGQEPTLLPRPDQKDLAKQLDMDTSSVSRCLKDNRAVKLRILWSAADSLESVLKFERRR